MILIASPSQVWSTEFALVAWTIVYHAWSLENVAYDF